MTSRLRHLLLAWIAVTAAGCVVGSHLALERLRASFETEAQSTYQALAQGMREHETLLEALALLQPVAPDGAAAGQRLGSLYPAVHQVLRRDEGAAWPRESGQLLADAEERSQRSARAVLVQLDLSAGSYWLVRHAQPVAYALQVDLRQLASLAVQATQSGRSEASVWLEQAGARRVVVAGAAALDEGSGWRFGFRRRLGLDAAAVDFVAQRRVDWLALPWTGLAAWFLATSVAALAIAAWWRGMAARAPRRGVPPGQLGWKTRPAAGRRDPPGADGPVTAPVPLPGPSAVAHRQPLLVTLREVDAEPPELVAARGAIRDAARQSRRTAEVIARMRRSAERPDVEGRLQRVDWEEILRDALELIEPQCERLGVVTALSVDEAARRVRADAVVLEQIVHHLLHHALRSLESVPPGERRIELALVVRDDCSAMLSVRDTGSGLPAPDTPPGLEILPGATWRGQPLGRCAALAAGMGGSLAATPAAPRGTLFRLSLPLAD